jgi:hypothetical protein
MNVRRAYEEGGGGEYEVGGDEGAVRRTTDLHHNLSDASNVMHEQGTLNTSRISLAVT